MGLITWIAIAVIVLVVIWLGAGVFFSGLIRGAEIIGNNPAVQNVTQEAKEFLNGNLHGSSSSSSVLVITTNEARYRISEPVTITVKNIGDVTLTFPNSAAGLKIQNMNMGQIYNVAAAQVMPELGPGASRMIPRNQEDSSGNNVQTTLSSSSAQRTSSQVSFEIIE